MKYLLTGYDYLYATTQKPFNVYKCLSCKSEQIVPIPKNKDLVSFYPRSYYSYNTFLKNSLNKSFFVKIREKLIDLSYNNKAKKNVYYVIAFFMRPFFQGLPLKHEGNQKFLDVGCGDTYNVNLMSRYGWDSVGFEIGEKKIIGNIYYDIDFTNVNFHGTKFDCIRVWHVLEHVPNPDQFIKKLANIVDAKGKMLIGLPNTSSLAAFLFGKYWYNRDLPRHIINYNPVSLNRLLNKNGLKITKLSYSSAGGVLGSIQYLINKSFKIKLNLIGNTYLFILFFPIDILLNILCIGDCISVIVEKNRKIRL